MRCECGKEMRLSGYDTIGDLLREGGIEIWRCECGKWKEGEYVKVEDWKKKSELEVM